MSPVRFNSTTPTSEITNKLTQFTEDAITTSTMTSDQLGYLQSIGMGEGYGPTAIIERMLEFTHVYTGLPWWGTILAATVITRVFMFPLYMKASANTAKMTKIKPQLDATAQQMRVAETMQERTEASFARTKLMKEHGIKMSHGFLPFIQIPFAYGFFQALRKMANHPVEGFSTQGTAWFTDLTQVDPYLGLQIVAGTIIMGQFKIGGETGAMNMSPVMQKFIYLAPVLSIFVTKGFSAAVLLYFAANASFSFLQAIVLRSKYFRRFFKMPPISKPPPSASGAQNQSLGDWWKDFSKTTQQTTTSKMQQSDRKLAAMQKRRQDTTKNFIKRR
ncbi:hypothetical protein CANTEDRAFT_99155 [Yamadazyma tenuis ATCC 10573]|uniref:Membrane insertase YidC/Oxa/ALB C-terminal domain-containing protein n=2 Tax=Candida tenuis TaxID=2315449 RepID=G3BAH8_CANTC|nr:uncharacterized protein CANTEDRAFT_99155 [Yamadazyma tenuis ATCC 10573]EGV62066.1 hypothetical protein CANTEDRAFT_99155 [Yamadazyma tenuis ATCC 10573]